MRERVTWRVAVKRRLDEPRRRAAVAPHYDPEAFGRVSEGIARYFGTARYLVIQTALVIVWIGINAAWAAGRWDPYPFILLNLAFSTQAAYAAPLILLAQTRQADRDKAAAIELGRMSAAQQAHIEGETGQLRELLQVNTRLTEQIAELTTELHATLCSGDGPPRPSALGS